MTSVIEAELAKMGYELPDAPAPAANYVPYVTSGKLVFVSGQISRDHEGLLTGKLGADVDIEFGQNAARSCALALLAQVRAACDGDLDRLKQVVRLGGFVSSAPDFADHALVINGASDLIGQACGNKGAHARAAVGCASLPFNVSVEIEGIFEIT